VQQHTNNTNGSFSTQQRVLHDIETSLLQLKLNSNNQSDQHAESINDLFYLINETRVEDLNLILTRLQEMNDSRDNFFKVNMGEFKRLEIGLVTILLAVLLLFGVTNIFTFWLTKRHYDRQTNTTNTTTDIELTDTTTPNP
jgi:hypothetical protein